EADLLGGINQLRWIEYSLSSTLMVLLIAQLVGIFDIAALLGIAGANLSMILLGWVAERHAQDRRARRERVDWSAYIFGCITGIFPWIAIAIYLIGADGAPTFVYGIFVSLFVFFNSFAIVMLLEYLRIGPWRRVVFAERSYIVLSLTAKVALTWQVAANVLIG
ncbi:MAG: heliorhodopsin HeR, partial [Gaiellales bacterium]